MVDHSGRIPEDFIQTLLSRVDIVEVIGEHVPLRKSGANYMACCPFHSEKTPSFSVNQSKQFYHCFGCGVSGDAIQFLKENNGYNFVEAVELLAGQVGLQMPLFEKSQPNAEQNLIYNVLSEASSFYEQQLRQHATAALAVQYLKDRGLTGTVAKKFGIGYAPPGWDNLLTSIAQDAEAKDTGVKAGLFVNRESDRYYDRFRNRVMFPIRNRRGSIIGFGGRILDNATDEPKYLNSPETPVFNKSYELYGLYEAKQDIAKANSVIVVEGYMDVVSLSQAGITNVVATLGTACTTHHVKQLFKLATDIIFCFDGDKAGKKAAWRSLELCLPLLDDKHRVKFLALGNGVDPDSYVRQNGVEAWQREVAGAASLPDYLFATITKQVDLEQIDGRVQVANEIKQLLVQMPDSILKSMLFDRLGTIINMDPAKLHNEVTMPEHRWSKFSQTVVRKQGKQSEVSVLLVSPAMRALSLLVTHRELLAKLPDLTGIEKIDIAGCKLLFAVSQILLMDNDLTDEQIKDRLDKKFGKYFIPAQLRGIARLVPEAGLTQEFLGALTLLRKRENELAMDELLLKAKQNALSASDKIRLQQLLQEKSSDL